MLPCGHTYCKDCTCLILSVRSTLRCGRNVTCPICREVCACNSVRYVLLGSKCKEEGQEDSEDVANVDHTSKILAVVKTLLKIQKKEPGAKTLVFSWVSS